MGQLVREGNFPLADDTNTQDKLFVSKIMLTSFSTELSTTCKNLNIAVL